MAHHDTDLPYTLVFRRKPSFYLLQIIRILIAGAATSFLLAHTTPAVWAIGCALVLLSLLLQPQRSVHTSLLLHQTWFWMGSEKVPQVPLADATTRSGAPQRRMLETALAPAPAKNEFAYDVFLSYHAPDRAAAALLNEQLRQAGLRPWFDQDEILAGQQWMDRIEQGIGQARAIAVIIGPSGIGDWQRQEAAVAVRLGVKAAGTRPVIPVLLPGADRHALPLLLDSFSWVEFQRSLDEPVAFARLVMGITTHGSSMQPPAIASNELVWDRARYEHSQEQRQEQER